VRWIWGKVSGNLRQSMIMTADSRYAVGPEPVSIYLSLGSNISPRRLFIADSLTALAEIAAEAFRCSSLYLTAPYQGLTQAAYYNVAVGFKTRLAPSALLQICQQIERNQGRIRSGQRWEARCIDIDILLWGNAVINQPELTVPHYDLSQRDFFLVPLLELDPHLINPRTGLTLQQELAAIPDRLRTLPQKQGRP